MYKGNVEEEKRERQVKKEENQEKMHQKYEEMKNEREKDEGEKEKNSKQGGGDGEKMKAYFEEKQSSLCSDFMSQIMVESLKMGESNACMKRIVAAPTAGSCGVLPAILIPYYKMGKANLETIIEAMYVAAGIGQVIAYRASISGAEGGCQAEIGTASAMAAAALTYLEGGSFEQISIATGIVLKNVMGLVCDPVAGLVEIPCIKRNVMGAMNALISAEMAMAGIENKIPTDQIIDAMKEVGDKMDSTLKETGKGGLANTEFARKFTESLHEEE